ncbi:MAG: hypothetical protein ACFE8U_07385 [Candidatus Hermodarchaeota archaeon]
MVDGVYVIHQSSSIPIYSKMFDNSSLTSVGDDLVAGLMSAIIKFGEHIQIGQITNFDSAEHRVVVASSNNNILAVVLDPRKHRIQDPHSLSAYLLEEFEKRFPELKEESLPTEINTREFNDIVTKVIDLNVLPFFYNVVTWANKEFGGEVFVRQEQFTSDEKSVIIDIVLDRGEKPKHLMDRITDRIIGKDFSRDTAYVKVIEGQAGSGEISEFFKLCSTFGRRRGNDDVPSYFPSLAVVVAQSYSPTVPRIIDSLQKKNGKHILVPEAAPRIAKMIKQPPKSHQCYVQLWKWDQQYPDLVYE